MPDLYLVDTNAVTALIKKDQHLLALVQNVELVVPVIVLGEMYYGAENSQRREANLKEIKDFMSRRKVLYCDEDTAYVFGRLMAMLKAKGHPIPQNDAWIAALALQHQLALLTRDSDFKAVDGLNVVGW